MFSRSLRSLLAHPRPLTPITKHRPLSSTPTLSASTPSSSTISSTAKAEGGPKKGSLSATMQSQTTRQRNAEQADAEVAAKLDTAPGSITSDDAAYAQSREARATGVAPPAGGVAQVAQKQAAMNEGATGGTSATSATSSTGALGGTDPAVQSQVDREKNYQDAAGSVAAKMDSDPGSVRKEEADLLHSREQRAFGTTEKGGLASEAQSVASKNE